MFAAIAFLSSVPLTNGTSLVISSSSALMKRVLNAFPKVLKFAKEPPKETNVTYAKQTAIAMTTGTKIVICDTEKLSVSEIQAVL